MSEEEKKREGRGEEARGRWAMWEVRTQVRKKEGGDKRQHAMQSVPVQVHGEMDWWQELGVKGSIFRPLHVF